MKAISLWQPWASLIAAGAKTIETRDWPAARHLWGQRIAIHAAKRWPRDLQELATSEPFYTHLRQVLEPDQSPAKDLPLGAIVCTVELVRCTRMRSEAVALLERRAPVEHAFGHYAPGRWAWVLRNVQRLAQPFELRGSQGFFELPPEALAATTGQEVLL